MHLKLSNPFYFAKTLSRIYHIFPSSVIQEFWKFTMPFIILTRSQLAVTDFHEDISLEQATGKGDERFNVTLSKATKQWSVHQMVKETIKSAAKNENLTILLFPNSQKIWLESQNLIKLLLFKIKNQDLVSEFSFFNCIYYFLHPSKNSNTWHSSHKLLEKVLLFSIRHKKESLSYFLFLTSWILTK